MRQRLIAITLALTAGSAAFAQSFYLSVDAPADLGATYEATQILRNDGGTYTPMLSMPSDGALDALYRMGNGHWLFSVEAPALLGGTFYEPRDVVERDLSGGYALRFDGSLEGVPAGAAVDAVYEDGVDLVLSFDVPVRLGGAWYLPADLVRWNGAGFTLEFDSAAAGIATSGNVTGADVRAGLTILTFDVTTDTPSGPFHPGELVAWDGISFSLYYVDAAWPVTNRIDALSFLASPGSTPQIVLSKLSASQLTISWTDSCSADADDYAIYAGTLGSWYSHACVVPGDTDGAALSEPVTFGAADEYYLVVGYNANDEGSYGIDSAGAERPTGGSTCNSMSTQELGCP